MMSRSRVTRGLLLLSTLAAAAVIGMPATLAQSDEAERVREATTVLSEIMNAPDHAVPNSIAGKAEGIAVFPSLLKGGFVVGAQWGRGLISARDREKGTWSSPAFLTITGGSFGAQVGGQAVDLVLVIMSRRGLTQLLGNQFKIGVDAAAAAGPVGRNAEASTDIQLRAQILSYSRSRGLYIGVTLNGATIREDRDANKRFYGERFHSKEIVLEGRSGAPSPVPEWTAALIKYF
jgi:lipid-binding SYLF domain-containing protein